MVILTSALLLGLALVALGYFGCAFIGYQFQSERYAPHPSDVRWAIWIERSRTWGLFSEEGVFAAGFSDELIYTEIPRTEVVPWPDHRSIIGILRSLIPIFDEGFGAHGVRVGTLSRRVTNVPGLPSDVYFTARVRFPSWIAFLAIAVGIAFAFRASGIGRGPDNGIPQNQTGLRQASSREEDVM